MKEWQAQRNRYLKKWREMDVSEFPEETQRLLWGSADRSIRHNMTPDDLAAVLKERRGVVITDNTSEVYDHLKEWRQARNSITNTIGHKGKYKQNGEFESPRGIIGRLKRLEEAGREDSVEYSVLENKLRSMSRLFDKYRDTIQGNR